MTQPIDELRANARELGLTVDTDERVMRRRHQEERAELANRQSQERLTMEDRFRRERLGLLVQPEVLDRVDAAAEASILGTCAPVYRTKDSVVKATDPEGVDSGERTVVLHKVDCTCGVSAHQGGVWYYDEERALASWKRRVANVDQRSLTDPDARVIPCTPHSVAGPRTTVEDVRTGWIADAVRVSQDVDDGVLADGIDTDEGWVVTHAVAAPDDPTRCGRREQHISECEEPHQCGNCDGSRQDVAGAEDNAGVHSDADPGL